MSEAESTATPSEAPAQAAESEARRLGAEEGRGRIAQVSRRRDVEIQQTRQREVDVGDFVEGDSLFEADQPSQLRLGERERCGGSEPRPLGPAELDETRDGDFFAAAGHAAILWHPVVSSLNGVRPHLNGV